jgi:hypothetical protein
MVPLDREQFRAWCLAITLLVSPKLSLAADSEEPSQGGAATTALPKPPTTDAPHPLTPVLEYARKEQAFLRNTVKGFTCRLVKRERIENTLQDYHYIDMEVREEIRSGERVEKPLSIFLKFLGPDDVAGRRVLYVEGQNEGKMVVRNGGRRFAHVVVKIDPRGERASRESLVPITEIGFEQLLSRMIVILETHARIDTTGENTQVRRIAGAKLDKRPCTVIRVTHPEKQVGLNFHEANVFVDDALHVPVRVDYSDWPEQPGAAPRLMAEYSYTSLELNPSLGDDRFDPALLRAHESD